VDGVDRLALVVENDRDELVGVARYDRVPGTCDAEVAVVVQDGYQQHHVGTSLLVLLTAQARINGIRRFMADVLMENSPMFATFRDAGLTATTQYERGVAHLVLPIPL
jgi:N-acetylglutamate synthase-like GNAT family acetyltransferase